MRTNEKWFHLSQRPRGGRKKHTYTPCPSAPFPKFDPTSLTATLQDICAPALQPLAEPKLKPASRWSPPEASKCKINTDSIFYYTRSIATYSPQKMFPTDNTHATMPTTHIFHITRYAISKLHALLRTGTPTDHCNNRKFFLNLSQPKIREIKAPLHENKMSTIIGKLTQGRLQATEYSVVPLVVAGVGRNRQVSKQLARPRLCVFRLYGFVAEHALPACGAEQPARFLQVPQVLGATKARRASFQPAVQIGQRPA